MQTIESTTRTLNVTLLEPRLKHSTIFEWYDALAAGEKFCILNDHDPKPLYYQMIAERGNAFSFTYLENGPEWWRIEIKKNPADSSETIGQIVAKDIRKAELLKKLGIDFCCGGKKTLKQACEEKQLSFEAVQQQLDTPVATSSHDRNDYAKWDASFLADYIYNQHHVYYYEQLPLINQLIDKVTAKHSPHYPELTNLHAAFRQLQEELNVHFMKEEKVLFPLIKQMTEAFRNPAAPKPFLNSAEEPIEGMEADHDMAGEVLRYMSALTNGYTPPQGACNSFRLLYAKLQDLENDLHIHVHLENNILFPKTLELQKTLYAKSVN